jgi:hypothetical protein
VVAKARSCDAAGSVEWVRKEGLGPRFGDSTWAFVLEPVDGGRRTRLITRLHYYRVPSGSTLGRCQRSPRVDTIPSSCPPAGPAFVMTAIGARQDCPGRPVAKDGVQPSGLGQ